MDANKGNNGDVNNNNQNVKLIDYPTPWKDPDIKHLKLIKDIIKRAEKVLADKSNLTDGSRDLPKFISETSECIDYFLQDQIEKCLINLTEKASHSLYHRYGLGIVIAINAIWSMDQETISHAVAQVNLVVDYFDKKRNHDWGLFTSPDYDKLTDEQAHATLCYTELNSILAMLEALSDRSFRGFISAAIKLKSAYSTFKECLVLYRKMPFSSEKASEEFHTGVRMISGLFAICLSMLPSRLVAILEFFGWKSNAEEGMRVLIKCLEHKNSVRYGAVSLFVVCCVGVERNLFGIGEPDLPLLDKIAQDWTDKYPQSLIIKMLAALRHMNYSQFEEANNLFCQSLSCPSFSPYIYKAPYFLMSLMSMQMCRWTQAANIAKNLVGDKISPATSTYLYVVMLLMDYDLNGNTSHKKEIIELLRQIPSLKKTLGGRKPFHEKLVYERTIKFDGNLDRYFLPTFEIGYIWNLFRMARFDQPLINKYLQIVDNKLQSMDKEKNMENYATCLFYKGHFNEILNNFDDAIDYLTQLISCKSKIPSNGKHLIAQAFYELGNIHRKLGRFEDAEKFLQRAKMQRNYLTESMISHRIAVLLDKIKKVNKLGRRLSSPYGRRRSSLFDPTIISKA